MELRHTRIPVRFLEQLPDGLKYLHRHGKEYLVVERLVCPSGHSLMATSVHIHEEPSIRLRVKAGDREGFIYVDAFWGSHDKLYSFLPVLADEHPVLETFCPECGVSLDAEEPCEEPGCGSTRCIVFRLPGATNRICVCSRLGCPWHRMDITAMPAAIARSVSEINYFGHGDEESFQGI
jgi:hypothetical protein